jgi:hypothetical protein
MFTRRRTETSAQQCPGSDIPQPAAKPVRQPARLSEATPRPGCGTLFNRNADSPPAKAGVCFSASDVTEAWILFDLQSALGLTTAAVQMGSFRCHPNAAFATFRREEISPVSGGRKWRSGLTEGSGELANLTQLGMSETHARSTSSIILPLLIYNLPRFVVAHRPSGRPPPSHGPCCIDLICLASSALV